MLISVRGATRVELASGERVALQLPTGAALEATAALESGWIAAGTQPVPEGNGGRELLLLRGEGRTISELPVPQGRRAATRQEPLPMIEDGRLSGLVWLEGDDRQSFGVRFASWNGLEWDEPRTIAAPGPGSQLALTSARLADGSWLLAWSAFDGQDDEIVWSRGRDGEWSRPQRAVANNEIPDITPALTAAGRGALLAWSRFEDGEYRTVVSRFQGGKWAPPESAGAPGSVFPTFEATSGQPLLLYRTAVPRGWALVELDAAGRPRRAAGVAAAISHRPVVDAEGGAVTFRWPASGTERAARWIKSEKNSRQERRP